MDFRVEGPIVAHGTVNQCAADLPRRISLICCRYFRLRGMGCGVSRVGLSSHEGWVDIRRSDFKLPVSRLTFTERQLLTLNRKLTHLVECDTGQGREKQTSYLSVVVERLVQRLVCNIGNLDPRFSSKFLINLEPLKSYNFEPKKNLKYKYMVRLDLISSPAIYPELFEAPLKVVEGNDDEKLPQGYARIRVHGEFLEEWMGFISPTGYLRRDKIQEKFIELLAKASAKPTEPFTPKEVDESMLCGSPGKVVDPVTLHHILQTSSSHRFFFGTAECNEFRFPDPRDFRIAIVEGVPETRLHISFLSPTAQSITTDDDVEISIVLGIGVAGWPSCTNYPFRLPLDHPDVILGYHAAQMGYYLVPKEPHSSSYCDDRASAWEIRTLATEMFLQHHYSPGSVVFRVHKILVYLLEVLRARGVKSINRYILKTQLLFELEEKSNQQQWAPSMISRRVLSIFDRLLGSLKTHNIPSFIFPRKNLLLQQDTLEDDYISDADILETYLRLLCSDGGASEHVDNEWISIKDLMENTMLQKWENVVLSMLPPMSNRSTRMSAVNNSSTSISYTRQQVQYVALLIRLMLKLKNAQTRHEGRLGKLETEKVEQNLETEMSNREDFIYLLQVVFEQAKQKLVSSADSRSLAHRTGRRKMFKKNRILLSYDISTAMLLDDIRRWDEMNFKFQDDVDIVVKMMECLYKAVDADGRVLGLILRPYLNQLFRGSHENCWFLQEWKKKTDLSEMQAMDAFGRLVLSGKIAPYDGIVNAAEKGWIWAETCLRIVQTIKEETEKRLLLGEKINSDESGLRLIFTPKPQKTIRFNVTLMADKDKKKIRAELVGGDSRYATIRSFQEVLDAGISSDNIEIRKSQIPTGLKITNEKQLPHAILRDGNSFTVASMETRRQGNNRGLGSIVQALISLQKLTVLQEISQYLPEKERTRVLGDIKKLSKEVQRLSVENYRKNSFSPLRNTKSRFSFKKSTKLLNSRELSQPRRERTAVEKQPLEIYRTINEFSSRQKSVRKKRNQNKSEVVEEKSNSTLLGTCRFLRQQHHATVLGTNPLPTISMTGTHKRGPSALPNSIINTPYYIRISSFDSKVFTETTDF
ncbi:hypothetical protein RUM44_002721 [Polyplax serrata]|uniref:Mab-21-like HhH/H2TH-like domain-containing protein n=1 Tax=Polyplax serrata TaxID=468196 RepID=A0ABR1AFL0_POLSC